MKGAGRLLMGSMLLALTAPAFAGVKDGVDAWQAGDYARAIGEWKGPAAKGDADAQFNLAQAYKLGRGVPIDLRVAEGWYRKAADQGHEQAQATLGLIMFQNGDRQGALPWLRQAADRGEPRAQYVYGTTLFNGDLVAKDWPRAYALMTRAAAAGLPQASASLQQMDQFIPVTERKAGIELAKGFPKAPSGAPAVETTAKPEPRPVRMAGASLPIRTTAVPGPAETPMAAKPTARPVTKPTPVATQRPAPAPKAVDPVKPAIAPKPKPKPAPERTVVAAKPAAGGAWRVQLGAYGTTQGAQSAWSALAGKLQGFRPDYVKAGPVVRLQLAGIAGKAAATKACGAARAAGSACFVVAP